MKRFNVIAHKGGKEREKYDSLFPNLNWVTGRFPFEICLVAKISDEEAKYLAHEGETLYFADTWNSVEYKPDSGKYLLKIYSISFNGKFIEFDSLSEAAERGQHGLTFTQDECYQIGKLDK